MNKQLLVSALKSRYPWWFASLSVAATLSVGQVVGRVSNQQAAIALGGAAPFLAASWWLGKRIDEDVTLIQCKNDLQFRWQLDRAAEAVDLGRAQFDYLYNQLTGAPQQGAIGGGLPSIEAMQAQMAQLMGGGEGLPALPGMAMVETGAIAASPAKDYFDTEDLAALMARNATVKEDCGSVLIACPKGTGKSNLLRAAIAHANTITNGMIDFSVFNAKEDRDEHGKIVSTFCGLEKSRDDYINAGEDTVIPEVARRLQAITETMERRRNGHPMVQILDEYNNLLLAADTYDQYVRFPGDKENPPEPKLAPLITYSTIKRGTKGRSKLVSDWITSHSPYVQDLKLNTALQESYTFIVLGRGDKLSAIHSALKGSRSVVKNEAARAELKAKFEAWENAGMNTGDRVVALTNMGGKWRLVYLPQYPDHQNDITRTAMNQSTEELLSGDSGNVPAEFRQPSGDVPQPSDETPRNAEVSSEDSRQILERCINTGFEDLSRNRFDSDNAKNGAKSLVERIIECRNAGKNQKDSIIEIWGVKPGESARYEECRKIYQAIAAEIRDNK